MRRSSLSVITFATLSLVLTACPTPPSKPDASETEFDAGNPPPRDACSGGCAGNQVCDTAKRTCVDACGGCDAGTCVRVSEGVYQCRSQAVSCDNGATTCDPGQVACIGNECSCLSSLSGALDTCRTVGKWCNGKVCANPRALQQCNQGDPTATCPASHKCIPVFGEDMAMCLKDCASDAQCDRGDICWQYEQNASACLPAGLFGSQECNQTKVSADGGFEAADGGGLVRQTVTVGNTCLLKDASGNPTEAPGKGTGNCTYAVFQFWNDGVFPFDTCRPPGNATEGQSCRDDYSASNPLATLCGTGLQCARTRGGDEGVCLRMCNAQPPVLGFTSQPACNATEACVNMLRYTDPNTNAVLGVCMNKCNVFDPASASCANVGSTSASCVPTEATGELVVTLNGDGICVPQRAQVAAVGQPCSETDAFKGAACASGQVCTSLSADKPATCTAVCDLECNPADGGTGPARCATEPNARCASGKQCKRVTSTTGARVGFCL